MKTLLRLAVVAALAIWAWRYLVHARGPQERASVSFADGSEIVLEPGSAPFTRLASVARGVLPT